VTQATATTHSKEIEELSTSLEFALTERDRAAEAAAAREAELRGRIQAESETAAERVAAAESARVAMAHELAAVKTALELKTVDLHGLEDAAAHAAATTTTLLVQVYLHAPWPCDLPYDGLPALTGSKRRQ
jgi:hypothetical protein